MKYEKKIGQVESKGFKNFLRLDPVLFWYVPVLRDMKNVSKQWRIYGRSLEAYTSPRCEIKEFAKKRKRESKNTDS